MHLSVSEMSTLQQIAAPSIAHCKCQGCWWRLFACSTGSKFGWNWPIQWRNVCCFCMFWQHVTGHTWNAGVKSRHTSTLGNMLELLCRYV